MAPASVEPDPARLRHRAKLSVRESWNASGPLSSTIFGLTVPLAIPGFANNQVMALLLLPNAAGEVIGVTVSLLFALVSASVFTTLYGIAVENRSIVLRAARFGMLRNGPVPDNPAQDRSGAEFTW